MARFQIVDLDKFDTSKGFASLEEWWSSYSKAFLFPEETEAKWKEVFDEGVSTGKTDGNCGGVSYKEIESDWEDLKKTL